MRSRPRDTEATEVPPWDWTKPRLDTAVFPVGEALSADTRMSISASSSMDQGLVGGIILVIIAVIVGGPEARMSQEDASSQAV